MNKRVERQASLKERRRPNMIRLCRLRSWSGDQSRMQTLSLISALQGDLESKE